MKSVIKSIKVLGNTLEKVEALKAEAVAEIIREFNSSGRVSLLEEAELQGISRQVLADLLTTAASDCPASIVGIGYNGKSISRLLITEQKSKKKKGKATSDKDTEEKQTKTKTKGKSKSKKEKGWEAPTIESALEAILEYLKGKKAVRGSATERNELIASIESKGFAKGHKTRLNIDLMRLWELTAISDDDEQGNSLWAIAEDLL